MLRRNGVAVCALFALIRFVLNMVGIALMLSMFRSRGMSALVVAWLSEMKELCSRFRLCSHHSSQC